MNPLLVTLTTNRAGTTFLYFLFSRLYGDAVRVEHEPLSQRETGLRRYFRCYEPSRREEVLADPLLAGYFDGIERSLRDKPVLLFGNVFSHLAPVLAVRFGERIRLLVLSRHPMAMAASFYVMTNPAWWRDVPPFDKNLRGNKLVPSDPTVQHPAWASCWGSASLFEKILYQYLERMSFALEMTKSYPGIPSTRLRSEDLFRHPADARKVMDLVGLPSLDPSAAASAAPRNKVWKRHLEARPLREEWRAYAGHPDLITLGERLGYDMSEAAVEKIVAKYRLPPGLGARVRHATHFWQIRRGVTDALRRTGLIGAPRSAKGTDPDGAARRVGSHPGR